MYIQAEVLSVFLFFLKKKQEQKKILKNKSNNAYESDAEGIALPILF
jgi:hypothetical protein